MRLAVLALLTACARPPALPVDLPAELPADQTRQYTIWLGGARVGTATEHETWTSQGVKLVREEELHFLRGDTEVGVATTIVIDADPALVAQHVRWTESVGTPGAATEDAVTHAGTNPSGATNIMASDEHERGAEATRGRDGWQLSTGGSLTADAVPAELVPLLVRRDGSFTGTVFLPARGFVAGTGRIGPVAPGRLVARIALDAGPMVEATIDLDRDGAPARVVDGQGVIAMRASADQAAAEFPAVDLIAATAIPIAGTRHGDHLLLDGNLALPGVPGQRAHPTATGLDVELGPALGGSLPEGPHYRDRTREIRALVAAVQTRITPDLGASPSSARDAAAATAGDCTTFALAYAALAAQRAIPTRVVTGLRVDPADRPGSRQPPHTDDRLIRHRWAVSWTGTRWIAIDAAFGAAPAGGNLIGLAVHGADDAGLVAGEAALTQVRAASWANPQ